MSVIRSFRDLDAWKKAMLLSAETYRVTASFPRSGQFGLVQQMRRAAVSIPSNIAEGHSRRARQAYINHVNIALGSVAELETQIELAGQLGMTAQDAMQPLTRVLRDVGQLLMALVHALEKPIQQQ